MTLYFIHHRIISKGSTCNAGAAGDADSIPASGRSPGGGNGNPLQYSCLEISMDRRARQQTFLRVTKSQTRLKQLSMHHECFNALWWLCISFITNLSIIIEQFIKQPSTIYEVFCLPSLQKDKRTNQKLELNLLSHELTGYTANTAWGPSTDQSAWCL